MNSRSKSIEDEGLKNTDGGIILRVPVRDGNAVYGVLNEQNELIAPPVGSLESARNLADYYHVQDQRVIDVGNLEEVYRYAVEKKREDYYRKKGM